MKNSYSTRKVQKNSFSGYTGIYWNKKSRNWMAKINYKGSSIYIGTYKDIDDAIAARKKTEQGCETFKQLEVPEFEIMRYEDSPCYLYAIIPWTDIPIYIEGASND